MTTLEDNERHIAALRARSAEERKRIAALNAKLGDLKRLLVPASHQLDDVDMFFLGPEALAQRREPGELAYWLRQADIVMRMAVATRDHVEMLADKYGPDARLMGG
jgi:hypothetical protein